MPMCRYFSVEVSSNSWMKQPPTFPSAQASISWSGRRARGMEVVHHHVGSPRNMMIAQNEKMTRPRVRISLVDSGGGCFLEATTSSSGGVESEPASLSSITGSSVMMSEIENGYAIVLRMGLNMRGGYKLVFRGHVASQLTYISGEFGQANIIMLMHIESTSCAPKNNQHLNAIIAITVTLTTNSTT